MSFWELLLGAVVVSLISILATPALWSSYASPMELLKKKWNDRADK